MSARYVKMLILPTTIICSLFNTQYTLAMLQKVVFARKAVLEKAPKFNPKTKKSSVQAFEITEGNLTKYINNQEAYKKKNSIDACKGCPQLAICKKINKEVLCKGCKPFKECAICKRLQDCNRINNALEYIEKNSINPFEKNSSDQTLLNIFCEKTDNVKFIEHLLKNGFVQVINDEDKNGKTPLLCAIIKKHIGMLNLLLSYQAKINKPNRDNKTPLYTAVETGNIKIVDLLLQKGATLNELESPLILACSTGHIEIMQKILKYWPKEINTPCSDHSIGKYYPDDVYAGRTLLWIACAHGNIEIVEFLLSHGAIIPDIDTFRELCAVACSYQFCREIGTETAIRKKASIEKALEKCYLAQNVAQKILEKTKKYYI